MKKEVLETVSIKKFQEENKFWQEITDQIVKILNEASLERKTERAEAGLEINENSGGLAFLGLSGGKTPIPLYKLLQVEKRLDWSKIEVFLVDERIVPREDSRSNSHMIRENLYGGLNNANLAYFHDFMTELEEKEAIEQYEEEWAMVPEEQLDIAVLGVGTDGHFASVFPGYVEQSQKQYDEGKIAMSTKTEEFEVKERLTLTAELIKKAKNIFIVIKGKEKLGILEEILNGEKNVEEFPIKCLLNKNLLETQTIRIFYCD